MRISDWSSDVCSSDLPAMDHVVLPVGVPIRLITTATDVIHSWAVPAFWIKLDAIPGRLNETSFTIEKPGVYFGQCSELCGARHAFMPIAVEAVPAAEFAAWVRAKGGTMPGDAAAARSEEHTSELQSLMRISYAVFCLQKKKNNKKYNN